MALQSKLSVYLIVEDKIIDYIIYDKLIIEVDSFARRMTKLDIGSFVLTDPVISLRPCYHSITCMCAYVYLCIHVYMCMCVCLYTCVYVYVCVCMCVYMYRDFMTSCNTNKRQKLLEGFFPLIFKYFTCYN